VLALEIVVGDVRFDFFERGGVVFVFGHFEFRLEGSEARFHECVVVTVVRTTHALPHLGAAEHTAVLGTGVLAATVGMVHQARTRLSRPDGRRQGVQDELLGHVLDQLPADDASRKTIHQRR
jgi:hypothetical protein